MISVMRYTTRIANPMAQPVANALSTSLTLTFQLSSSRYSMLCSPFSKCAVGVSAQHLIQLFKPFYTATFISMHLCMSLVGHYFKVLDAIIQAVVILVMHYFAWPFKFSTKMLFHYVPMLTNKLRDSINHFRNHHITCNYMPRTSSVGNPKSCLRTPMSPKSLIVKYAEFFYLCIGRAIDSLACHSIVVSIVSMKTNLRAKLTSSFSLKRVATPLAFASYHSRNYIT